MMIIETTAMHYGLSPMEIEEFAKMFPSGTILMNLNFFRQNIWRLYTMYTWGLVEHSQLQKNDLQ